MCYIQTRFAHLDPRFRDRGIFYFLIFSSMENLIKVNRPLFSTSREFGLGAGLLIYLDRASDPLIAFLKEEYDKNPDVLSGDIRSLLAWNTPYQTKS